MFVNKNYNPQGVYGVRIFRNGVPRLILIDDNIVCNNGNIAFARANGNELWVILLEKAFAKSFGSYLRIIGGWAAETLRDLTGAPTEKYNHDECDADKMFEVIYNGEERNYMMCASKNKTSGPKTAGGETLDKSLGLVGGHAYSILSARTVVGSDG